MRRDRNVRAVLGTSLDAIHVYRDVLADPLPIASGPRWGVPEGVGLGAEPLEAKGHVHLVAVLGPQVRGHDDAGELSGRRSQREVLRDRAARQCDRDRLRLKADASRRIDELQQLTGRGVKGDAAR